MLRNEFTLPAALAALEPMRLGERALGLDTPGWLYEFKFNGFRLMAQFGTFGLNTPGIENVTNTARRTGHRQPASWPRPVLLYNASNDQAQTCAHALAGWLGNQPGFLQMPPTPLPLPTRLHGDPKVIEFWIPAPPR